MHRCTKQQLPQMAVMSALWHGAPEQGGEDTALENFFEQAAQR